MTANSANHDFDDELLSAYVDGELTTAERALVEERLRTYPAAAALVEELRGLSAAVKSLPRETLGRDLRATILAEASEARADLAAHSPARDDQLEPLPPHNHWQGIRRGLVWSAFAIAATLVFAIFQPAEENPERGDLAQAERKVKTAAPANRFEEHSGAAQEKLTDGEGGAIDHIAADDRLPPGLRGGMSAAPASAPAERAADPLNESLAESACNASASPQSMEPTEQPAASLGALDSDGASSGAPSSSIASAPAPMAASSEPQFAAAPAAGRAGGAVGGEARPTGGVEVASPMTVTLRTTGPGGAQRFEQLLAESRLALESFDKSTEQPPAGLLADAAAAAPAATDALASVETNGRRQAAARITDGVIVEATPQQIEQLLAKCRADQQTFAAVEVQPQTAAYRSQYFAEGGFGGGGGGAAPPTLTRDNMRLLWARELQATPRSRELGEGQQGEEKSVAAKNLADDAEAESSADDLAQFSMRKQAAPVDAPAPLAAQPEEAATRSSLMTAPATEPSAAPSESPANKETKSDQRAAPPAPRIRVLFLLEPADAPARAAE